MSGNSKSFLRNAVVLSAALVVIILFMENWGAAQIIIVALVALLTAGQWGLFFYMKKQK